MEWIKRFKSLLKLFEETLEKGPLKKLVENEKRKKTTYITTGVVVLIILLFVFRQGQTYSTSEWAVAKSGNFYIDLIESGDIEAVSQVQITAPMLMGGSLQVIELVPEGTEVKEGDFLLQFDTSTLEQQKQQREDQLEGLLADLERTKAQQALQIFNLENQLATTEYSYQQSTLQLEMRKYESEVNQEEARIQLKQAEITLKKVQTQLESQRIINKNQILKQEWSIEQARERIQMVNDYIDQYQLKAPIEGMVAYEQWQGERVKEGYEPMPGQPLLSIIPDFNRMQAKLFVNEVDRLRIHLGQKAEIVLDAYPDVTFHGEVINIATLASAVTGHDRLKGFVAYVAIEESDPRMKPGSTAKIRIILDQLEDVIYLPIHAVFELDGQPVVFPKGKDNPISVVLGPRNDGYVVIESGVEPGMQFSWTSPMMPEGDLLGQADEQKRIDEIAQTLQQSFVVFQEYGILHDYKGTAEQESSSGPAVNLDDLPASIRQRLQRSDTEN
ncbi:HlyD family efflux transporter periplasmic adaptor subunit [bacterium]|nr:HlyD family efflux transporter periplasmic adaptor subunit [bacterium]